MINLDRANKENIQLILDKCAELGIKKRTHRAYILATAYHETNGTFNPVREAYWLDDPDAYLRKHHPEYYPYYGRGFAQLTWHHNYKKYEDLLHVPLTSNPDLALDPDIAAFIIVHGMTTGTFTGKRVYDYIYSTKLDFYNARRVVNGTDKAQLIADYAVEFIELA